MTIETTRSVASVRLLASAEFKRTGVLWSRAASTVVFPRKDKSPVDGAVHKLIRKEAQQAKRPFIHATSEWYAAVGDEGAERLITILTIPRLSKLRTVTMALFMASVEDEGSRWSRYSTEHPVTHWDNKTNHYFQFAGDVGHRIFESWIDQCVSDPVFRVVLGNLPPPVTPEVTDIPLAA